MYDINMHLLDSNVVDQASYYNNRNINVTQNQRHRFKNIYGM